MSTASIEDKQQRYPQIIFIEYLRILGCVAVVAIHTVYIGYQQTHMIQEVPLNVRSIYMMINNLSLFAVPIFLMISGYIFLDPARGITMKKMYLGYSLRIVLCILCYGISFSILENIMIQKTINMDVFTQAILDVVSGRTWAHMWYLYVILGIYLITPFIKVLVKGLDKKYLEILLGLLFVVNLVIPTVEKILHLSISIEVPFNGPFIFYFILGYYLRTISLESKGRKRIYWLGILAIGLNISYSLYVLYDKGIDVSAFSDYDSPTTALSAIMLFVLFQYAFVEMKKLPKIVAFLSSCTFGIYLVHPIYINLAYKFFKVVPTEMDVIVGIPLFLIAFLGLSLGMVAILRQIPIIKKYLL